MAWNPFDHHRGPFTFCVTRPKENPREGTYPFAYETLPGTVSGSDVEDEARALLADPRDTIVSVAVWSVSEQQHVMTYRKDDPVRAKAVAAPIEPEAPAAVSTPAAVAIAVAPATPRRDPKPEKRTRGAKLVIGKRDGWPASKGAQIVRQFFHPDRQATTQEIVGAVGEQLKAEGIEFPGSLVSRLKQAGFLTEAA
jgi:hypothetical protein